MRTHGTTFAVTAGFAGRTASRGRAAAAVLLLAAAVGCAPAAPSPDTEAPPSSSGPAPGSASASASSPGTGQTAAAVPTPASTPTPGLGAECAAVRCFSMMLAGDLLVHPQLWTQAGADAAVSGKMPLDFTPLLEGKRAYLNSADLGICHIDRKSVV